MIPACHHINIEKSNNDDVPVSSCSQVWKLGPSDLTH